MSNIYAESGIKKNTKICKLEDLEEDRAITKKGKDKYMKHCRNILSINPTLYIDKNNSINSIINDVKNNKWNKFIIKPIGATTADGFQIFKNNKYVKTELYELSMIDFF